MRASPTMIVPRDVSPCSILLQIPGASGCSADQRPTDVCKFKGIKDTQGECYPRGEAPPTPRIQSKPTSSEQSPSRRAYPINFGEFNARELPVD